MTVNRIIEDKELGPFVCPGQCPGTASYFPYKGRWNLRDCASPDFSCRDRECHRAASSASEGCQTEAGQKAD